MKSKDYSIRTKLKVTWIVFLSFGHILRRIWSGYSWNSLALNLEEPNGDRLHIYFSHGTTSFSLQERWTQKPMGTEHERKA